jgi:hypothetical protein
MRDLPGAGAARSARAAAQRRRRADRRNSRSTWAGDPVIIHDTPEPDPVPDPQHDQEDPNGDRI